jgi:hypothetical protein
LNEAVTKLKSALPKVILVSADALGLKGMMGIAEETRNGIATKQDFLLRLSPHFEASIGKRQRQARWDEVLFTAQAFGLSHQSLVVIAALSAILVPNGGGPARRLLKFRQNYTRELAYNAVADLRSLEVLMHTFGQFPQQHVMLCTADKDLALFWAGLRASNFNHTKGGLKCNLDPIDLFPGITDKQLSMFIGPAIS